MPQKRKYLYKEDFDKWVANDYAHFKKKVDCLEKKVSFIKGQLWVILPILVAIATAIIALVFKGG
mgnify:CR=1 FL=1